MHVRPKIIAHRGLTHGPNKAIENAPDQIKTALSWGYDAEVDVWFTNNRWYTGHDEPVYPINPDFLMNMGLWIHAKNIDALAELVGNDYFYSTNYFWHQNDDFTLTNEKIIWTYPGRPLTPNSVCVIPDDESLLSEVIKKDIHGICTKWAKKLDSLLG